MFRFKDTYRTSGRGITVILGIGTDIVEIVRVSERLGRKILTEREREYLPPTRAEEYLAGRFAAKEAISKALGTGIGKFVGFADIEVIPNSMGAPEVTLSQRVYQQFFQGRKVVIHLSLSHTDQVAVAMAVVEEISA